MLTTRTTLQEALEEKLQRENLELFTENLKHTEQLRSLSHSNSSVSYERGAPVPPPPSHFTADLSDSTRERGTPVPE